MEKQQSRSGKGQYSTVKRVATVRERQQADLDRVAVANSISHNVWLIDNGMGEIEADEIFSSVRR